MKHWISIYMVIVLTISGFGFVAAQDNPPNNQVPATEAVTSQSSDSLFYDPAYMAGKPPIEKIGDARYRFGDLTIDKQENYVELPVTINMNKGLLEYLLVGNAGKVHESLLKTGVEAQILQTALLFLGLQGTKNPLSQQGDVRAPEGDKVELWIVVSKEPPSEPIHLEDWVINKTKDKPLEPVQWVFTGSYFNQDHMFMAQTESSLIALYRDPAAIIDNPLPDGSRDDIWFSREGTVPAVGTEVTLRIKKVATPMTEEIR